jgi:hypothetical protein
MTNEEFKEEITMKKMKRLTGLFAVLAAPAILIWTFAPAEWEGQLFSYKLPGLAVAAPASTVFLPACGSNPAANTRVLQQAVNTAPDGATLVFPSGVCVLAKCSIANSGGACAGLNGAGQYRSAVDIGKKTNLTVAGAADGTSVLKLDPDPPRRSDGYHGYCGDTHVLSIRKSSHITLRDFTIDGSDGELPEDTSQCPPGNGLGGKIAEHMHGVQVENSTDISIDRMKIIKAHGDGLNLIADRTPANTNILFTERVSVTNTHFLDNDRSGLAFQRNVGHVQIRGNYFRNSGSDQDLDMEPTGGLDDRGPYETDIDNNLFERVRPGLTVTLGASRTQPSNGVRFTRNTIRSASPETAEGGCILVYKANNTVIANNTIIGGGRCTTLAAQRVTGLQVINNHLEGYANVADGDTGVFRPRPVIAVAEDVVNQGDPEICGAPPKAETCPYFIHYPERITITGNRIIQRLRQSPGIALSNVDELMLANNIILHTQSIAAAGPFNPDNAAARQPAGIDLSFGLFLGDYGHFVKEKTLFNGWSITGNGLSQFADGIRIRRLKESVSVNGAVVNNNKFYTAQSSPRGIWLVGATAAPNDGFINSLIVDGNLFSCGFPPGPTLPGWPPPLSRNTYVCPSGQPHMGNVGATVVCQK